MFSLKSGLYAPFSILVFGASACATPPPIDGITSFSNSVEKQMQATVDALEKFNPNIDLVAAEHRSVARAGAFYEYEGDQSDCEIADPLAADITLAKLEVGSRCILKPRVRDPSTRERKDYDIASGMTEEERQLLSAKGLASDVRTYAIALNDIATATDLDAINKSLENALKSSKSAAESIAKFGDKDGLEQKLGSAIDGGIGVFSAAIQTGLDTARSNALRRAVVSSDETIDSAARQFGILLHEHEGDAVKSQQTFKAAYLDQIKRSASPEIPEEERVKGYATLGAARKNLIDADKKRLSIQVLDIARTHHAIYLSYTEPDNVAAFNAAQLQILDLVTKTDAFIKQIEDL